MAAERNAWAVNLEIVAHTSANNTFMPIRVELDIPDRLASRPGPGPGQKLHAKRTSCTQAVRATKLQVRFDRVVLIAVKLTAHIREAIRKCTFDASKASLHFIHIPKNAGETVRSTLYLDRRVSFSNPYHYRYVDIADEVGRHLKFFAVIRNPWSRTASRFQFGKQNAARWPVNDPRRLFIENATFSDFVLKREILPIPKHPNQPWMGPLSSWFNQLDWIRAEDGKVACDCLRMEVLGNDLSRYMNRRVRLRDTNVTKRRYDYRTLYSDGLAEVVSQIFREDIDYFGFTFDGPATKHFYTAG